MKRLVLLSFAMVLALGACTTRYIGNTKIEDTEQNREILRVIEQYRRAVDDRDAPRILELTSASFFEDPGTPNDPSDDYDKAGLRRKLEEVFSTVEDQRLRIDVLKLEMNKEKDRAFVEYRYDLRYRLNLPNAREWREAKDLNRVELRREDGQWRFVSGL